ncbi:hypothetical protein [Flavobacterium granuli]|uniref:Uncharacterized protein n=1 Tax=Flavobacterium granuli TaxID=280093 RepID=A0ABU1S4I3_9FLAO|nr:hypothetical protein [Flavobacterium granuli]MDR6845939.1 hypothetical protein [Flavobacterium granuli]
MKQRFPELYNEAVQEGVRQERQRVEESRTKTPTEKEAEAAFDFKL